MDIFKCDHSEECNNKECDHARPHIELFDEYDDEHGGCTFKVKSCTEKSYCHIADRVVRCKKHDETSDYPKFCKEE
jgi:hypothetical protein